MIVPVRCFTCGKVLADKYDYYVRCVEKLKKQQAKSKAKAKDASPFFEGLRTAPILDELGLTRYCSRRAMLGTVDLMDTI